MITEKDIDRFINHSKVISLLSRRKDTPAEIAFGDFLKTVDPDEEIIFKALEGVSLPNGTATPSKLLEDPAFAGYLSLKVQSIASAIGKEGNAVLSLELSKGGEKEPEHQITFRDFLSVGSKDNEVFFDICSHKHIRPICSGNSYRDQILTESGYKMFLEMTGLFVYPGKDSFGNPTLKVRIFNFYD